jgi:hypothetical protein
MWTSGIAGWKADWRAADFQIAHHADALRAVVGVRLSGAWVVRTEDGELFADMPVVLQLDDGRQLEMCWQKFDDLSISWNTIDLNVQPRGWIGDLSWRRWGHPALQSNANETVTAVGQTGFEFTTTDQKRAEMVATSAWITSGIWISTTGQGSTFSTHSTKMG